MCRRETSRQDVRIPVELPCLAACCILSGPPHTISAIPASQTLKREGTAILSQIKATTLSAKRYRHDRDRVPSRHVATIAMARQYPPAPSSRVQCIEYTRRVRLSRRVRTHSLITYSLGSSNTVIHNVRLLSRYESWKSRDQRNCRRLMLTTWSYY
jgi:hypothetical protein